MYVYFRTNAFSWDTLNWSHRPTHGPLISIAQKTDENITSQFSWMWEIDVSPMNGVCATWLTSRLCKSFNSIRKTDKLARWISFQQQRLVLPTLCNLICNVLDQIWDPKVWKGALEKLEPIVRNLERGTERGRSMKRNILSQSRTTSLKATCSC